MLRAILTSGSEFAKAARDFPVALRNNWHETGQYRARVRNTGRGHVTLSCMEETEMRIDSSCAAASVQTAADHNRRPLLHFREIARLEESASLVSWALLEGLHTHLRYVRVSFDGITGYAISQTCVNKVCLTRHTARPPALWASSFEDACCICNKVLQMFCLANLISFCYTHTRVVRKNMKHYRLQNTENYLTPIKILENYFLKIIFYIKK